MAGRSTNGPDVSREGVQRDILPIVEGSTVNTKYGVVKTDYMLFIAAGAFHVAKVTDLIPELQGRFPVRVNLKPLTREDFKAILSQTDNALTRQYEALLAVDHIELVLRRLRETVGRIEHRADEVRVARAARAVDVLPQPLALLQAPGVHALVHRDDELGVFRSQKVKEQLLFGLHA